MRYSHIFLSAVLVSALVSSYGLAVVPADFDGDGDVDGNDFLTFNGSCYNGANRPPHPFPDCFTSSVDLDGDGDVDPKDFLTFSNCFNGSLNPPKPICLNLNLDLDGDGDIDANDFLTFSNCFNGSLNPPACP